jgi:hypothetical protein
MFVAMEPMEKDAVEEDQGHGGLLDDMDASYKT